MEHYATVSGGYRAARATVDQARIARKIGTLHWQAGDRAEAMASYRRALEQISVRPRISKRPPLSGAGAGRLSQWRQPEGRRMGRTRGAIGGACAHRARRRRGPSPHGGDDSNRAGDQYDRRRARAVGSARRARERIERSLEAAQDLTPRRRLPCVRESRRPLQLGGTETGDRRLAHRPRDRVKDRRRLAPVLYLREPGHRTARSPSAATLKASRQRMRRPRSTASWDSWTTSRVPLVVIAQIHQCRGELQKASRRIAKRWRWPRRLVSRS